MYPTYQKKTLFVIVRGIYYYKVVLFKLKNVGATYQLLVNRMLSEFLKEKIEVYIDDMHVKSLHAADHIQHLW